MAAPNIVNVSAIYGKTAVQVVGTSATAIVTNGAGSNKVLKVNALLAANVDGVVNYILDVDLFRSSTGYRLAFQLIIPAGGTVEVLSKPIYLEEGDSLRLNANTASKIEAICSYEEIN